MKSCDMRKICLTIEHVQYKRISDSSNVALVERISSKELINEEQLVQQLTKENIEIQLKQTSEKHKAQFE